MPLDLYSVRVAITKRELVNYLNSLGYEEENIANSDFQQEAVKMVSETLKGRSIISHFVCTCGNYSESCRAFDCYWHIYHVTDSGVVCLCDNPEHPFKECPYDMFNPECELYCANETPYIERERSSNMIDKGKLELLLLRHNQTQLAKDSGLSYTTLHKLVNHKYEFKNMRLTTLSKLAKGLKIPLTKLVKEIYLP